MQTKFPLKKAVLLIPFLLPLLMLYPVLCSHWHPDWMLTGKLLLLSLCPLLALIVFQRRYGMDYRPTDLLISFTLSHSICLIYYNFEPFTHWLLLSGAWLQGANLLLFVCFFCRHRQVCPIRTGIALFFVLIGFWGIWMGLALQVFTPLWLAVILPGIVAYLLLLRLPPPSVTEASVSPVPYAGCTLYFGNFEERLKELGFDNRTIRLIQHKCNTSSRHLQRVAEYTRVLCVSMGFSAGQTEQISCAALLHDIGKLEIPDDILFDSGKLTRDAVALLHSHNRLGYELLSREDSDLFRLAADVALLHHERMDGTGYLGLRADEISLPARIVAVADVFDALTAPRIYKQPWDFEAAFSHIVKNRGIHFDSTVVDDFIKCKPAIRQIYDSYTTPTH